MAALSIIEGRRIAGCKSSAVWDSGQWTSAPLFMWTANQHITTDHEIQWLRLSSSAAFSTPPNFLPLCLSLPVISGMTGNYLLTNPLLRTHDTNPYNNLLAETVVCNTPSPPAFHSPGAHPPSTFFLMHFICFFVLFLLFLLCLKQHYVSFSCSFLDEWQTKGL